MAAAGKRASLRRASNMADWISQMENRDDQGETPQTKTVEQRSSVRWSEPDEDERRLSKPESEGRSLSKGRQSAATLLEEVNRDEEENRRRTRKSFAGLFNAIEISEEQLAARQALLRMRRENESCSGIFADFIYRSKARGSVADQALSMNAWFEKIFSNAQDFNPEAMFSAAGVLQYEQLLSSFMESITAESKLRQIFPPAERGTWRRLARTIYNLKRMKRLIDTEVTNWLFRFNLLNAPVQHGKEEKHTKKARQEEFWENGFRPQTRGRLEGNSSDDIPRYRMGMELRAGFGINGMRWNVGSAGTLSHQHLHREGMLTENCRPQDKRGDGRFPPKNLLNVEDVDSRPTSKLSRTSSQSLYPLRARRERYFEACDLSKSVPLSVEFMTGHSPKLEAKGHLFTDAELLSIVAMLRERTPVQEVLLERNALLTDSSLVPLLRELCDEALSSEIRVLNIAHCSRAGKRTVSCAIEFVAAASLLRHLDISGLTVGTQYHLPLCKAIGAQGQMETVCISNIGLGVSSCLTMDCLTALLEGNMVLRKLDVSWNRFANEEMAHMGHLVTDIKVEELIVDNSAAYIIGQDSPVLYLAEALAKDKYLKRLSLVSTRIDFKGALVLEDSFDVHPSLKAMDMRQNQLGALGMRSMLRLLSRKANALQHFDSDGCFQGQHVTEEGAEDVNKGCQVYSFTNPGSKYILNLDRCYHRSLLRMLYKTSERCNLKLEEAFEHIHYSRPPYEHATKDSYGLWQVNTYGTLSCIFSVEVQIESVISGIEDDNFLGFLDTHFANSRFKADYKKITPLFAMWKELAGHEIARSVYLDALAKDFNMPLPYLAYLCESDPGNSHHTMVKMLPTVSSDSQSRYLAMMCLPKLADLYMSYSKMENLLMFNAQNPTGHYKLDLGNCCDFAVAQRLLLLDRWESVVNKRHGRVDTSARHNRSHLRNEMHRGRPLHLRGVKSVAEWSLPECDIFETDYMSSYRTPPSAKALSSKLWENLMVTQYRSPCKTSEKMKVLRSISHTIFITCMHMRQMVGFFKERSDREEALVIFYLRVIDPQNQKLFRVRFEDDSEIKRLRERLGYAVGFPFLQPENATFSLDLRFYDQRLCAALIVDLMQREKASNIRDAVFEKDDGTVDTHILAMGIPRSWCSQDRLPTSGVFRCKYVCAPEFRNIAYRRKLAATYGYFHQEYFDHDIRWWTGLKEAGDDVLDLLEFLISRYNNVQEAFFEIDGGPAPDVNAELTLRELESGLKDIGCHKFDGPDEKERIGAVFRYLDPGGEGTVSLNEWQILGQLWDEFELSIREFVQFLEFVFGENLEVAWEGLDDDGSGELNEEEWFEAVKRIGYFGPARVVFALLDSSDDGNISWDEFKILENYKGKSDRFYSKGSGSGGRFFSKGTDRTWSKSSEES